MARFRRRARRSAPARRSFARARARSGNINPATIVLPAMIYGGIRAKVSSLVNQYIPGVLGQYTDEVVLGVAGYYLAKKNTGMLRNIGLAALTIESASVGNQLIAPMVSNVSSGSSSGSLYGSSAGIQIGNI